MTQLLYESGLRLMECLRLDMKDVELSNRQIIVQDGKGEKDQLTVLPEAVIPCIKAHLEKVKRIHQKYLQEGFNAGYDIRTVQELLSHKGVITIMIYTHVLNRVPKVVSSQLDSK